MLNYMVNKLQAVIMEHYARHNINEFVICLSYKAEYVKSLLSTNGFKATGFQPVRFSVMYYNLPSHF